MKSISMGTKKKVYKSIRMAAQNKWRIAMKLDRIKFAKLVSHVQSLLNRRDTLTEDDIADLDYIVDIEVPTNQYVEADKVNELLRQLNAFDGFIPAIKAYRVLTGQGLKESKEAIERYRFMDKIKNYD